MPDEVRRTQRGFRIFAERERPREEWLYGGLTVVSVVESSLAFRGAHVRIYEGDDAVQLNVREARIVRDALTDFLSAADDGELTKPAFRDA